MDETKNPLASLGVMGPLVGAIAWGLNTFIFKAEIILAEDSVNLVDAGIGFWTVATGIWGRWRATKRIAV